MKKAISIAIIPSIVLLLTIGCQPQAQPAEPLIPQPEKIEALRPQPPIIEPEKPQPEPPPPAPVEPEKVKPVEPEVKKPEIKTPEISSADYFQAKCAPILKMFARKDGKVNYRLLKFKSLHLNALQDEFTNLSTDEYDKWPEEDKIAFWINAYNIQMLKIIIDNYPIQSTRVRRLFWPPTSIRHIEGIWDRHKFIVMDEEFTLKQIEQRFFRDGFNEPRVFFAICLASYSGPKLLNHPYYGTTLDEQLENQTKDFLARPDVFKIDRNEKKVYLSAILQPGWYGTQFLNKFAIDKKFKDHPPEIRAVLNFITNYTSQPNVSFLETENYTIEYIRYDWRLNE